MSDGDILDFSAFMTRLAECTERAEPAEFRQDALRALQQHVGFVAAIWGSAAIGAGLAFREVVMVGLPESAIAEVEAGASADPRLLRVLGDPGTCIAYSVGAEDPEIMQVQMARYGVRHIKIGRASCRERVCSTV